MFKRKNKSAFLAVLVSQLLFWSCNDADFSGASSTKKPPPKEEPIQTAPKEVVQTPTKDLLPQPSEVVSNSDGTVTEKFFGQTETEAQADVEVIFVVDTSGSMDDEKSMLEQNISKFLTDLNTSGRLNHQVFMIGTDFNFPVLDATRFTVIDEEVGSWDALTKVKNFLDNPNIATLPLRASASKEIVIITDDDSIPRKGGILAKDFITYLGTKTATLGTIHVNGFVWLPSSVKNNNCTKANQGTQYIELSNDPTFGGDVFDLCSSDWGALLKEFAAKIISSNAQVEFALKTVVNESQELKVFVNDSQIESEFWTYSSKNNSIIFDVDHAPKAGDTLAVIYSPRE